MRQTWRDLISADDDVMLGKPCLKGTRITVELVLERLGGGWTIPQLLDSYPHITEAQVLAAIRCGGRSVHARWMREYRPKRQKLGQRIANAINKSRAARTA